MFTLKEAIVEVRENSVRVRELTHTERLEWLRVAGEDRFRGPGLLVSLGTIEPRLTEEAVGELPADVVEVLASRILELSGMEVAKQKEPVAR